VAISGVVPPKPPGEKVFWLLFFKKVTSFFVLTGFGLPIRQPVHNQMRTTRISAALAFRRFVSQSNPVHNRPKICPLA
jgi:hypothetical protein